MNVQVERVGNTGRAFRIIDGNAIFQVRTQSRRRYLVLTDQCLVWMRTDNLKTARTEVPKMRKRFADGFILDTVMGEVVR